MQRLHHGVRLSEVFRAVHQGRQGQGLADPGRDLRHPEGFKTKLYEDAAFGAKVRQGIIDTMLAGGEILEQGETE